MIFLHIIQSYHALRRFSAYILKRQKSTLFRNCCHLDRVSPHMRYEADFLFDNGDYIRSRVIMF